MHTYVHICVCVCTHFQQILGFPFLTLACPHISLSLSRASDYDNLRYNVLSKEMVQLGMSMLKLLPCNVVDKMVQTLVKFKYGDLSRYSLHIPSKGPFHLKCTTGRSPIIDVGTVEKIKTEDIGVFPSIMSIERDIKFANGKTSSYQAIVFATGYKSNVRKWLKDDGALFNDDGMPVKKAPDHWKGENGLYCIGFARAGLFGISIDAQNIAKDISSILSQQKTVDQ